jgi:MOSC domain-containing protein
VAEEIVGKVARIQRYPVQSLGGEPLATAMIGAGGLWGDRAWGIFDPAEGKVVTAARGKKPWRDLVGWAARFRREPASAADAPPAEIALPDGGRIAGDDANADDRITNAIGAPARLVR